MRKLNAILISLVVTLWFASSAFSGNSFQTGNYVYENCDGSSRPYCSAYIQGMADVAIWYLQGEETNICLPLEFTLTQITDVYLAYLKDHSNLRHKDAAVLFHDALKEGFPCR